jgi:amino acid adenylation domain-containing protein
MNANVSSDEGVQLTDDIAGFALSPQQRHLWLLQKEGGEAAFQSACAVRLTGDLDRDRLRRALDAVVERHEILRTVFRGLPERATPLQVVLPPAGVEMLELTAPVEPGRDLPAAGPGSGSLLRAGLARLAEREHLLVLALPALCADARAMELLILEIGRAYAGEAGADEEPLQYADLAQWQNQILEAEDSEAGLALWRRLAMGTDFRSGRLACERPLRQGSFVPETVGVALPAGRIDGGLLAACWRLLLERLAGSEITVGAWFSGRDYEELAEALGVFARFLPLLWPLDAGLPLADAVASQNGALEEAGAWQHCFSWETVAPEACAAGPRPFCPYAFELRRAPAGAMFGGVRFAPEPARSCSDRFVLKLSCMAADDDFTAALHYDPTAFGRADVERLGASLRALLASAADGHRAADRLEFLGAEERRQLLVDFNATAREEAPEPVHRLFERWAAERPEAPALVAGDGTLSYRELDRRADRLAAGLRRHGVGPDARVALCFERSLETVVAMLGVLKAGGAYVPLDPALPLPRLRSMLADCAAAVLLASGEMAAALTSGQTAPPVCLDPQAPWEGAGPAVEAPTRIEVENLAYVIYTSGSTGQPKGVAVEHRQLCNYVRGVLDRLALPRGAVYASVSTVAADLGNTAIFAALCGGGCLHLVPQESAADPAAFRDYLRRHAVDCVKLVPSHLSALLQGERPEETLPRRVVVLGGESCHWDLVARVRAAAPSLRVLNHYGPTEATVGVLTGDAGAGAPGTASVPLTAPLANSRAYLVDAGLRPVPFWVAGELLLGGAGLARGYLGRPDLTAERFVPDPLSEVRGARLYRTGDLARQIPGAGLEVLGRTDHQVKVRGFRIEPGEIEAVLREGPGVLDVVVRAWDAAPGDRRLAAWLVTRDGGPVPGDLRRLVASRLPDYMVPAVFIPLRALPLTVNGKLDVGALPAAETGLPTAAEGQAARGPVEEMLAGIWAQVLGRDAVAADQSFFALGGHSLLAMQVISRIREAFGVEAPLHAVFEHPTVRGLAAWIETARAGERRQAPPIVPAARDGALPLSFSQHRLWFFDRFQGRNSFYNLPLAVRLRGRLDRAALEATLTEVVRRHEVLRTTYPERNGEPVQRVHPHERAAIPLLDLTPLGARAESVAEALAAEEADRPFELARGPLLRAVLLRLGEEDHALLFTLHHIVSDAWSAGVLYREVAALYAAFREAGPRPGLRPLPDPAVQYADYAVWQRGWMRGEVLDEHLAYWRRQLAGAPEALDLPTDFPRRPVQTYATGEAPFAVDAPLAEELKALCQREGVTLFMALLAVFQVLLRQQTGQCDILIGTNVANRDQLATEGLIGFFVNQLVLRADLSGNPTFRQLLARVRAAALGAYEHQQLPFEKLVEELRPERDLSRSLVFQVKVELQNTPPRAIRLPDLEIEVFDHSRPIVRHDLHLAMVDAAGILQGRLLYNADLFEMGTASRLLEDYELLLKLAAGSPETSLDGMLAALTAAHESRRAAAEREYEQAVRQRFKGRRTTSGAGALR